MSEETMDKLAIFMLFFWVFLVGVFAGEYIANNDMREACQKKHNVYECELVAVPKEIKR